MWTKTLHTNPPKGLCSILEGVGKGSGRGDAGKKGDNSNTRKRNQHNMRGKRGTPGNKQLSRELKLEKFNWGSFEVVDDLGEGRCGKIRGHFASRESCD